LPTASIIACAACSITGVIISSPSDLALAFYCLETAELVALDEALENLAKVDELKSKIVELRYFGGLSVEETAEVLGVSAITVKRHWRMAKAWLFGQLTEK